MDQDSGVRHRYPRYPRPPSGASRSFQPWMQLPAGLWRIRPRLHVFGHVHESHGWEWVAFDTLQWAFEQAVLARGGLWNLLKVAWAFRQSMFGVLEGTKTLLVNPAIVGGLRDADRMAPVKVDI